MDFTSDGNIWFTVQHGNQIGYLDTKAREIKLHEVPTSGARPYGLIVHNDLPWVVLFGTNKLATVDANGKVTEVGLPREADRTRRLAVPKNGVVWYVVCAAGYLAQIGNATCKGKVC